MLRYTIVVTDDTALIGDGTCVITYRRECTLHERGSSFKIRHCLFGGHTAAGIKKKVDFYLFVFSKNRFFFSFHSDLKTLASESGQ